MLSAWEVMPPRYVLLETLGRKTEKPVALRWAMVGTADKSGSRLSMAERPDTSAITGRSPGVRVKVREAWFAGWRSGTLGCSPTTLRDSGRSGQLSASAAKAAAG